MKMENTPVYELLGFYLFIYYAICSTVLVYCVIRILFVFLGSNVNYF